VSLTEDERHRLADFRTRATTIREIAQRAPTIEDELVRMLSYRTHGLGFAIVRILALGGSERVLPAMQALARDPDIGAEAERAVDEIRKRAKDRGALPLADATRKLAPMSDEDLVRIAMEGLPVQVNTTTDGFDAVFALPKGRMQHVLVSFREIADQPLVTAYSVGAPVEPKHYEWALRNNARFPYGSLAIRDVDGAPHFVLTRSFLRESVTPEELRLCCRHIAEQADKLEKALTGGDRY
jgi:hypothetical protein